MIKSFNCKETKKIWSGAYSSKFPTNIQERALRKLRQLDASNILEDLKNPPGNNLELLKGNRKGQMTYELINNGEFVLPGKMMEHIMLKLLIIINKRKIYD